MHAEFPSAKISILVRKGNESIYHNHPFLHEVIIWNKQENKIRHLFELKKKIKQSKFDCVINCHRYASSGFLTAFSGAKHTAGFKQNPFSFLFHFSVKHIIGTGKHETERYTELVSDFCNQNVFQPKLYPSSLEFDRVSVYKSKGYVCLAPASVWFTKQLPKEKWIELCTQLNPNLNIYLLGAPSDIALCEEIKNSAHRTNITVLAGKLSLLQSCALMKDAKMNYVNDSAPLHLASAIDANVCVFFCSTVPEFGFGPLSTHQQIIEVKALNCRPCGLHGHNACPKGHFNCGYQLKLPELIS